VLSLVISEQRDNKKPRQGGGVLDSAGPYRLFRQ
jgi:hypothetical protein